MGTVDAPVTKAETLVTDDGVPIDAVHLAQDSDLAIVLAHGFTLSWQRPAGWQTATRPACSGWRAWSPSTSAATDGPADCAPWGTRRSGTWTWPSATPANWATPGWPRAGSPWGPRSCGPNRG